MPDHGTLARIEWGMLPHLASVIPRGPADEPAIGLGVVELVPGVLKIRGHRDDGGPRVTRDRRRSANDSRGHPNAGGAEVQARYEAAAPGHHPADLADRALGQGGVVLRQVRSALGTDRVAASEAWLPWDTGEVTEVITKASGLGDAPAGPPIVNGSP
jgi:hypothetical protein